MSYDGCAYGGAMLPPSNSAVFVARMPAHDFGIKHKVYVNRGYEPSTPYYSYTEINDLSGLPDVLGPRDSPAHRRA